jgi:hypothetical protein
MRAVHLAGPDWHRDGTHERWRPEFSWTGPVLSSLTELVPLAA